MKKMKENKGFTLVELIVVIVILAILAAILVPALLGYIDKAKKQQVVLDGKSVMTAAQTELSSAYAKGAKPKSIQASDIVKVADVEDKCKEFTIYAGKDTVTKENESSAVDTNHAAYTVYAVKYVSKSGDEIYYAYNKSTGKASWDSSSTDFDTVTGANGTASEVCKYPKTSNPSTTSTP